MIVHDRSELLTRLLRNLNTIPPEEYRGNQMWELVLQITDFSLKATANMFKSSYSETITVDFYPHRSILRRFRKLSSTSGRAL